METQEENYLKKIRELKDAYGLHEIQDWETREVLQHILLNWLNQNAMLIHNIQAYFTNDNNPTDLWDPKEPAAIAFVKELKEFFNKDAEILLHTYSASGDDGGPCYKCYILKPEHKEHYQEYWDKLWDTEPLTDIELTYIAFNPTHVSMVWVGPY